MKILKKIALITLSLFGALLVIAGLVIGYFYAFKLSNSSDLTPHSQTKWQASFYTKNAISPMISGLLTGDYASELKTVMKQLDSLKGESIEELKGVNIGHPIHFFGDEYEEKELMGEIYSVSNLKDFKATYKVNDQNVVFLSQGKSVCVLKSETLSKDQLEAYFKKYNWKKAKLDSKALITFTAVTPTGDKLIGKVTSKDNSLNLEMDIELKETYSYANENGSYSINFAEDKNGKPNPILKMMGLPLDYLFHDYKGLAIELTDGQPTATPVGPTFLKSNQIDSTWYRFKYPELSNCEKQQTNVICWKGNEELKPLASTPFYLKLKGIELLKFEGSPMITAFLSMSPLVGDLMEIISNMEEIEVKTVMNTDKMMHTTLRIQYDSSYNLMGDLLLYTLRNQYKFKEFESLINL